MLVKEYFEHFFKLKKENENSKKDLIKVKEENQKIRNDFEELKED